eukprot:c2419_g1_i1 orf=1-573(-)
MVDVATGDGGAGLHGLARKAMPGTKQGFQMYSSPSSFNPFTSSKPAFSLPGDYHRFVESGVPADATTWFGRTGCYDSDAFITQFQVNGTPYVIKDHGMEHNGWPANQKLHDAEACASPICTPGSGQGGRKIGQASLDRHSNMGLQTPGSNIGSPARRFRTPASSCRYDSSLGLLTKKFINLLKEADDGILD